MVVSGRGQDVADGFGALALNEAEREIESGPYAGGASEKRPLTTGRQDDENEDGTETTETRTVDTTVGRALLSELLPTGLSFELVNRDMTKKAISSCINESYRKVGLKKTVVFADRLMYMGFAYATRSGVSIGVNDMVVPEEKPETDLIMVATGTGIAPYRGFLRRLFVEETPAAAAFSGLAWLFLGVATTDALLYDDDWQKIAAERPDHFRLTYAISREQQRADGGGKMYVQDRLAENAEEIFERLDKGAHIYFCGLKGMMPGILATLEEVAVARGIEWAPKLESLKKAGQWHVEVY